MCVQETTMRAECGEAAGTLLPVDPYRSLRVSFGMLLGVDDFETLGAYHRGKTWLHSAWLHREGVVWGLDVRVETDVNEVEVLPGLALDRLGRELHLDVPQCVNVPRWVEEHKDDPELTLDPDGNGGLIFRAYVAIRFRACLARPVPSLTEPCEGAGGTTSYSRVSETVEVLLLPGRAPQPAALPYHRLRLLFALEPPRTDKDGVIVPADQEVLDERVRILGLSAELQPAEYLLAFRRFAAFDEIDLAPPVVEEGDETPLFPGIEPAPIPLANLLLTLDMDRKKLIGGKPDVTIRPSHVATSTIQELLCGPLWAMATPPPPEEPAEGETADYSAVDAGGPRVDGASVAATTKRLTLTVEGELHPASLSPAAFRVTTFDERDGWSGVEVRSVVHQKNGQVTVQLKETLRGQLVRLVIKGTGDRPVLGRNLIPLAGALGDPPAGAHDGRDFVIQMERRS